MLPFVKCVSQKDLQLQVDAKVIFIDYCALVLAVVLSFLLKFRQEWRYAVPTEVSSVKFCRHWRRYSLPTELKLCPSQWTSAIGVAWWGKDTFHRRPHFKKMERQQFLCPVLKAVRSADLGNLSEMKTHLIEILGQEKSSDPRIW